MNCLAFSPCNAGLVSSDGSLRPATVRLFVAAVSCEPKNVWPDSVGLPDLVISVDGVGSWAGGSSNVFASFRIDWVMVHVLYQTKSRDEDFDKLK